MFLSSNSKLPNLVKEVECETLASAILNWFFCKDATVQDDNTSQLAGDPSKKLLMLLKSYPELLGTSASVCPQFLQPLLLHLSEAVECTVTSEICTKAVVPLCSPHHAPPIAQIGAEDKTAPSASGTHGTKETTSTLSRSEIITYFCALFVHAGDEAQKAILSFVSQKALGGMTSSHLRSSPLPLWDELMQKLQESVTL